VFFNDELQGYRSVEVCFSPHYLFNDDLHNGNDFTPKDAIKTIRETLFRIGIAEDEMQEFKVCNLEYGLNLDTGLPIENLINGILYTKKTLFVNKNPNQKYFKISNSTQYKEIKAYAKGLQFLELPQYGIDKNVFRFEVRTKQSRNIKTFGIHTVADLLKLEVYNALFQSLINEWENVLIINLVLKNKVNTTEFWDDIFVHKDRNKFYKTKQKYYQNIEMKNNLHHLIKCKIIDKITSLQKGANSTQKIPINKGKLLNEKNPPNRIKYENAPFQFKDEVKNRLCIVTGLDISMQKKGSKFLSTTGLKYYIENDPIIYQKIELKYLTEKMRLRNIYDQLYFIAHNIRNANFNPNHNPKYNRKRFEERNYHQQQLQFEF
jgi:hypothetical protein